MYVSIAISNYARQTNLISMYKIKTTFSGEGKFQIMALSFSSSQNLLTTVTSHATVANTLLTIHATTYAVAVLW